MMSVGHKRARHLVEAEAFRRIMAGEAPASLDEFVEQLAAWLNGAYPGASPVTTDEIEDQIRDTWYRRHDMVRGGGS